MLTLLEEELHHLNPQLGSSYYYAQSLEALFGEGRSFCIHIHYMSLLHSPWIISAGCFDLLSFPCYPLGIPKKGQVSLFEFASPPCAWQMSLEQTHAHLYRQLPHAPGSKCFQALYTQHVEKCMSLHMQGVQTQRTLHHKLKNIVL